MYISTETTVSHKYTYWQIHQLQTELPFRHKTNMKMNISYACACAAECHKRLVQIRQFQEFSIATISVFRSVFNDYAPTKSNEYQMILL